MKTFLLRLKKFFSPLGVFKKRVKLDISIAKADQKGHICKEKYKQINIIRACKALNIYAFSLCHHIKGEIHPYHYGYNARCGYGSDKLNRAYAHTRANDLHSG
ncbi:TPA: hypothetical protein R1794_000473 [Campylobacter jejuni]|nr:hypothetical protein [Campylobacter jejuni]